MSTKASRRNSVEVIKLSGMKSSQIASSLFSYLQKSEFDKFRLVIDTLSKDSSRKKDLRFILNKWIHPDTKHYLLTYATDVNNIDLVKFLLSHQADPNVVMNFDSWKHRQASSLFLAIHNDSTEMVELLLSHKADPNHIDGEGRNAMSVMCAKNNIVMMESLMRHGWNWSKLINQQKKSGYTVFTNCIGNASFDAFKHLVKISESQTTKIDMYLTKTRDANNALQIACARADVRFVHFLVEKLKFCESGSNKNNKQNDVASINYVNKFGETAALMAAYKGDLDMMKCLHSYGADLNICDRFGKTPLHIACQEGWRKMVVWLIGGNNRCDTNIADKNGNTPVLTAIQHDTFTCIEALCLHFLSSSSSSSSSGASGGSRTGSSEVLEVLRRKALMQAAGQGDLKTLQLLLRTIIKKLGVDSFDALAREGVLNEGKMRDLQQIAEKNECLAVIKFLESIRSNAIETKNFGLLLAMLDYESNDVSKIRIKKRHDGMRKDSMIARKLFEYIGKIEDKNKSEMILDGLNDVINEMVRNKEVLNDCLLFFANLKDQAALVSSMKAAFQDIIQNKSTRDGSWYKQHILESNIWSLLSKDEVKESEIVKKQDEARNEIKNEKNELDRMLLFHKMKLSILEQEFEKQRKYLAQQIKNEEERNEAQWRNFVNYRHFTRVKHNIIRQDVSTHRFHPHENLMADTGTQPLFKQKELFVGSDEYDYNSYLTNLLINASRVNDDFQRECKNIFESKSFLVKCRFKSGPVKQAPRCQVKSMTDYKDRQWPRSANLVDVIRCSALFDEPKDLLDAVNRVRNIVDIGDGGCMKHIMRVKNSFQNIYEEMSYADIKVNVLVTAHNVSVVGEIQFILDFMQDFKDMGHKMYQFGRNESLFNELADLYYAYKFEEVTNIIAKKNFNALEQIMLFYDLNEMPVLSLHIWQNNWNAGLKLYWHSILQTKNDDLIGKVVNDATYWNHICTGGKVDQKLSWYALDLLASPLFKGYKGQSAEELKKLLQ